jgi:hypothetical protein
MKKRKIQNQAMADGFAAAREGKPITTNPHRDQSSTFFLWARGWWKAQRKNDANHCTSR